MSYLPYDEGTILLSKYVTPSLYGPIITLNAENKMDSIISNIKEQGGVIIKDKTKIEADELSYFSLFIDSEGNQMGLYGK